MNVLEIYGVSNNGYEVTKYSCVINGIIYFISCNKLYKIDFFDVYKFKSLTNAVEISLPDGTIAGLMAFDNKLYILIKSNEETLYEYDIEQQSLKTFAAFEYPEIRQYFITADHEYLLFFGYPSDSDGKSSIYIIDKHGNMRQYIFPICCDHIHSLCIYGGNFYVAIGDKTKNNRYSVKPAVYKAKIGTDMDLSRLTYSNITSDWQLSDVYRFVLLNDDKLRFGSDGRTILYDEYGNIVWSDYENAGFQIAASALFNTGNHVISVIGTWRRSPQYPHSCLYFLYDGKPFFKFIDRTVFNENMKWTGFHTYDCSLNMRNFIFWPNQNSGISVIMKYSNVSSDPLSSLQDCSIEGDLVYNNVDLLIYSNLENSWVKNIARL